MNSAADAGEGGITKVHARKLRLILAAHVFWMSVVFALGTWWTRLVHKQSSRIAELERLLGMPAEATLHQWNKTERMIHWESTTFMILLAVSTGLLFWLYWRDWFRSRSLHAFFASVTHELRTPLTSIRLQAESLAETVQGPLVDRLIEDTMRLESQVERTLELARIEGGGALFVQAIEIGPWLQQSLRHWREALKNRVEVKCEVEDSLIDADPTALQVILKNILENSVRHSGANPVSVLIRSGVEKNALWLHFSDNGQPFTGNLGRLGHLFEKGALSHGAGVGLYLVRTLMSRMDGKAEFRSSEGKGLQISLRFPLSKPGGASSHG